MNKKILWILLASLAVNVFLAVIVATSLSHGPKGPPPRLERMLEDMAATLPSSDALILRQAMETRRSALTGEMDNPRQHMDRLRQILSSEPFDLDTYLKANSEFRARRDHISTVMGDVLADALPKMSQEGRKRLADFRPGPK